MTTPFSVPFNISKGSATADSFRIAPPTPSLGRTTVDANGLLLSDSSYEMYGPGMLVTPLVTYNITPYPTTPNNIVANRGVTQQGWLTLTQDNGATTLIKSNNTGIFPKGAPNQAYLQMDWPRVPQVTVTGNLSGGTATITIFGFDYYNNPLQHSYQLTVPGLYPRSIINTENIQGKAFSKITGIYFDGATQGNPDTNFISVGASTMFGLPYVLKTFSDVSVFSWNNLDMSVQSGVALLQNGAARIVTPAVQALVEADSVVLNAANGFQRYGPSVSISYLGNSTLNPSSLFFSDITESSIGVEGSFTVRNNISGSVDRIVWSIPNGSKSIVAPASSVSNSAPALEGDVRGLIELPAFGNWQKSPDGETQLVFSFYCQGFDQTLTILNAGGQPQSNGVPGPEGTNIVPPNTVADRYGRLQYYTGVPGTGVA